MSAANAAPDDLEEYGVGQPVAEHLPRWFGEDQHGQNDEGEGQPVETTFTGPTLTATGRGAATRGRGVAKQESRPVGRPMRRRRSATPTPQ